jgi:hypothetical protein
VAGDLDLVGQPRSTGASAAMAWRVSLEGILRALGEHRPAVLVHDDDVEPFLGLLDDQIVGI